VVVVEQGGLKGLRPSDGVEIWNQADAPNSGVIGTESEGILSTDNEVLAAFDLETGNERWRAQLEPGGGVNLALGEGFACAERLSPQGDAVVQCFSAIDGSPLWTRRMERTGWIVIAGGLLVLSGGEAVGEPGWVAVDPRTGETAWKRRDLALLDVTREPEGDLLVACQTDSGECFAVNAADGSVAWQASVGQPIGRFVAASGRLMIFSPSLPEASIIHVLDTVTGEPRGTIVPDQEGVTGVCSGPSISGNLILVYGCGGFLLAYRLP
jgi:outer membrane protein assembly factor BamB